MRQYLIEKKDPQHNQLWEWEETPELIEALKKLHPKSEPNRPHDYPGPLYAPHPDLTKND